MSQPLNEPRTKLAALLVAVGLSIIFIVLYGTTNWLTTLRKDVPSFYFEWERSIPVVPAMIVVYLSIDLFYVGAAFLTKTRRALMTLFWRVTVAIVVGCTCFLLFPLRFGFERPHAEGVLGYVFDQFRVMDPPFNEFPSLHIALAMVFGATFLRHTRGILRYAVATWLSLLAISPLLVYQHHVIDILGGFVLGTLCMHFIQEEPLRQPLVPNYRIAAYYFAGAAAVSAAAFLWRPWTLLLLWPATSLLIAALAYCWLGPGIYRKRDGRLPWTTWLLLWPILLGQRISLLHYARQCHPCDLVLPNLIVGRRLTNQEIANLGDRRISAVLDLTCEFSEAPSFRALPYRQLPILDLTAPTPEHLNAATAFIEEHALHGIVYVHCKIGFSRTAAVVGAYLIATGKAETPDAAIVMLQKLRPGLIARPEVVACLRHFAARHPQTSPV
jgi:membrane-associated phospholipid phosphatase